MMLGLSKKLISTQLLSMIQLAIMKKITVRKLFVSKSSVRETGVVCCYKTKFLELMIFCTQDDVHALILTLSSG